MAAERFQPHLELQMIKSMHQRVKETKIELDKAQKTYNEASKALENAQARCCHNWSQPERKCDTRPGYTIPGDEPGTMGVDHRGEMYVPPETSVWWERTCTHCGKVEKTTQSRPTGDVVPVFPSH